jgi:lipid-binding SYLF domain-containing protein
MEKLIASVAIGRAFRITFMITYLALLFGFFMPSNSHAETAREIEVSVDVALERFTREVKGGEEFLKAAKGVLILPGVFKAGFIFGGEYGEGALRVKGKTVDYYNIIAGSWGIQIGAQKKDVILVFMTNEALSAFRKSSGWKAGVDGSVAIVNVGVGDSIDTTKIKEPIVGFVFGQKGLMVNATIEGSKFTRLDKTE